MSGLTPSREDRAQELADASRALGGHPSTPKPKKPEKPRYQQVDGASLQQAKSDAARTGLPQPVRGPDGHVVYYVDSNGGVVPDTIAQDRLRSGGQKFTPSDQSKPDGGTKAYRQAAAEASKTKEQKAQEAAQRQQADAANGQYIWLDGHRVKVKKVAQSPSGAPTYTFATDQDGFQKTQSYTAPTAYAALDDASTTPSAATQFLMSQGLTGVDNKPMLDQADMGNGQITQSHANGRNEMTIGNALQWLANLSVKDPSSYTAMVDRLHSAGYLDDAHYMAAGGQYSQDVAGAFAAAAKDTAVLNSTDPTGSGYNMTLYQLLDKKAGAAQDLARKARAASYQPVQRTFTDPTEVKAAAKSAAQAAIGRNLTPEEEAKLTAHFHSLEAAKYNAIDSAGRNGDNATVTDPSVTGQTQAFVDTQDAQEEANYSTAGYGAALRNLFGLQG